MNWQWRMKILFVPSNRRRLPIERVERPSLGGSQGLRPPFQYPLKWRLRASSPFVTRAEFIRVSCKFYVEARTWRQKVRIPRIEIACFIFFFFFSPSSLLFSRGWRRSVIRVSLHTSIHRIDATDNLRNEKGFEMKVTRALQRNRFLRTRENYNVSVKINGGISRGQSRKGNFVEFSSHILR